MARHRACAVAPTRRLRTIAAHTGRSSTAASFGTLAGAARQSSAPDEAEEQQSELSERDKFLIDLQGFLVIPGVLSPDEVLSLNAAVDASWDSFYTDSAGETHACRTAGHQSKAFHELRGMLEWAKPHCQPFRDLLAHPNIIPCMNTLHGRGWRMDHSPFMICGDGTREISPTPGQEPAATGNIGNIGGEIHGHPWDPEYRYRFANGVMRSGHASAQAIPLRD